MECTAENVSKAWRQNKFFGGVYVWHMLGGRFEADLCMLIRRGGVVGSIFLILGLWAMD